MPGAQSQGPLQRHQHQRRFFLLTVLLVAIGTVYLLYPRHDPMALPTNEAVVPLGGPVASGNHGHGGHDAGPVLLADLPASRLPTAASTSPRLIIIGDVHGQIQSLRALLAEAGYSAARRDHVIFAGDMVTKGVDSPAVVALAMEMGASAVRGNHEDKVLRAWDEYSRKKGGGVRDEEHVAGKQDGAGRKGSQMHEEAEDSPALAVARSLTEEQRRWLAERPAILNLGTVPDHGPFVVVHAGLVPNLALEAQDAQAVMNRRTLLYPSNGGGGHHGKHHPPPDKGDDSRAGAVAKPLDGREGVPWSESWNAAQEALLARGHGPGLSVAYGHDARTGLNIRKWTYGLDSACVKGGQLSALVFAPGQDADGREVVVKSVVSIDCQEGASSSSVQDQHDKAKHKKNKKEKEKGKKDKGN